VDVIRRVLLQGAAIITSGLLAGLCGSLVLGRALAGMLYQVSARDPLTLADVSARFAAAALLACCMPAARAAHSDPLHFLRHD
jgi:putative ABC transport system permease protein